MRWASDADRERCAGRAGDPGFALRVGLSFRPEEGEVSIDGVAD